jgi:hypothetical protein
MIFRHASISGGWVAHWEGYAEIWATMSAPPPAAGATGAEVDLERLLCSWVQFAETYGYTDIAFTIYRIGLW